MDKHFTPWIESPLYKIRITRNEILKDYELAIKSRFASTIGFKEVLTGKAKFGIFGDGKELPQIVMAKAFQPGDFRSGYYRDQTFMFAAGVLTIREFFSQLYAHADLEFDPASGGRMMNSHFATRLLDEAGEFKDIVNLKNSSADLSSTAAQMPRALGLAYASKLYRQNSALKELSSKFSRSGNEVCFATIGNASTSEGHFFETVNAAGVLQVPLAISVWDDGYGISVPNNLQTMKNSISKLLAGIQQNETEKGFNLFAVKGWDYLGLIDAYFHGVEITRKEHIPSLFHVEEITQLQGHSTSGSHERYKNKERLQWEIDNDCNAKFRQFILQNNLSDEEDLLKLEKSSKEFVEKEKKAAYSAMQNAFKQEIDEAKEFLQTCTNRESCSQHGMQELRGTLDNAVVLSRKLIHSTLFKAAVVLRDCSCEIAQNQRTHLAEYRTRNEKKYDSSMFSNTKDSPLKKQSIAPIYSNSSPIIDGRHILLKCFEANFSRDPRIFVIGEDVGKLGDVNLVFEGLQQKFGELRFTDTGIREATIAGQGIGSALRGLRPIVDIQYVDYLLYALQTLSDDLASLNYRTAGGQKAPVVVRTKGHRLEGVWHSGSPMGTIINALRGIHVCVPRNMTQAAGMYNLLFRSDEPALLIEVLNGYRAKERLADNIGEFTVPLGEPEVIREGTDATIVTYGACCNIALEAAVELENIGINAEVIDIQTLLPFDLHHRILESIKKTNAVLFVDEDGPGGASAWMLQQVLEQQGAYEYLDAQPLTLTAKSHRPAYGTDGDYYSKPNSEQIYQCVYNLMRERAPKKYAPLP